MRMVWPSLRKLNPFRGWLGNLFIALLVLPIIFANVFFTHSFSYQGIAIHAHTEIPSEIKTSLDLAITKLSPPMLPNSEATFDVYLLNNRWERLYFGRSNHSAYAVTFGMFGKIFVMQPDAKNNIAYSGAPEYNKRSLSSVITHEGMHIQVWRQFGIKSLWIPSWKEEGFCEYVAKETSIPISEGLKLLRQQSVKDSGPFEYFKYYVAAKYLLDVKGMPVMKYFSSETAKPELTEAVWSEAFPHESWANVNAPIN